MVRRSRRHTFYERMRRLIHFRLIIPLKRSRHPPEYTARGVCVGLFWAFTPLVGIQMYLVFMTWLPMRRLQNFDFNMIIAFAWTWVSNVFTMIPLYYAFYVTGQVMLGRWDDLSGYGAFVQGWNTSFADHDGLWDSIVAYAGLIAVEQGQALMLGSLPYALGFGWLGYRWSLVFVRRRREERRRRFRFSREPDGPPLA